MTLTPGWPTLKVQTCEHFLLPLSLATLCSAGVTNDLTLDGTPDCHQLSGRG